MSGASPRVSVLLPVHDAAPHLRRALESVLTQTFRDFELLVVDDGSSDGSPEIAAACGDPRIRLVRRSHRGLVATLNEGLDLARGDYVVRMDADDECEPERLAEQLGFMQANPRIGIAGSFVRALFAGGRTQRWSFPCRPEEIRAGLLFEPTLAHPSTILRRHWLDRCGLRYDPRYARVEDWDLWRRAAERFPLANLPRVLLRYRVHDARTSHVHRAEQHAIAARIQGELLARLGVEAHPLRRVHADVSLGSLACRDRGRRFLVEVAEWFEVLRAANRERRLYDSAALDAFLGDRMLLVLHSNRRLLRPALGILFRRGWARRVNPAAALGFLVRAALPGAPTGPP